MADQATAHALDGTHRVIRCPLNLDHVQNVDLAVNDEGELEGQSNVMKYTCKKLEPPKDDPHARWAVGVYDKTTGRVDFKYVDGLPRNQMLKGIKCWPVAEIVTYGFDARNAPLDKGGTHLAPADFHKALEDPDAVVIDVRNYNESLIGKFAPPGDKVLDPMMRRSTEFPQWVADNRHKLEDKKVLMYCTGGVRCERASAYMGSQGIKNVFQLEGGIHRYLEEFQSDGGHWVGKNYTFDKRFSHGADNAAVISACVHCGDPWDRYQAQAKCANRSCAIEVLLCRPCQRQAGGPPPKASLFCDLCKPGGNKRARAA